MNLKFLYQILKFYLKNNKNIFIIFDKMNSLFEKLETYLEKKENIEFCCSHNETIKENDVICLECGEEIQRIINHEKDWKNSERTQMRNEEELIIAKDVKNMRFSKSIILKANEFSDSVREGKKLFRAGSRKGIIFACIY